MCGVVSGSGIAQILANLVHLASPTTMAASTSSSMSKLSKFREELQTLRSKLEPLSSVPDLGALSEHLGSLENARLNVLYAYTVNALLYSKQAKCSCFHSSL